MNSSDTHDPISAPGAYFKSEYISASDDVKLKVLQWQPEIKESEEPEKLVEPVIFVPGWISHVSSWAELLRSMTQKRPVFYIETREKISAQIKKEKIKIDDFTISRIALDLINVCKRLPIDLEQSIVMGSSFGATALLEALKNNNLNVRCAFLVGPNSEFAAHPLMQKLLLLPDFSYHFLKYFILWYLRTFRVDEKKEPEQMRRYKITVKTAHPRRIKMSVKAAMKYKLWPNLETVKTPTALAYAPTDTLHSKDNIKKIAQTLPFGQIIACPSNKYMHSADLLKDIEGFIKNK
ncbi:MAG: alpha/beta hydrolase [Deltaproteobacteria bacterium]|nr:alpha/beta hydrolase [Deltaproteobacteria bacterium]